MFKRQLYAQVLFLACTVGFLTGAASAADTIVVTWDKAALQAIRDTHPGPPQVARMLAITHTCIYDAWAAYDPIAVGTQLGGTLRRPISEGTTANRTQAISFAAYRCLTDLFPAESSMLDGQMTGLGYDPTDTSSDTTTPTGIGNTVAAAVILFRHPDGANQLGDLHPGPYSDYTGYVAINDPDNINNPDLWQPLRISDGMGGFVVQKYIAPFWGNVAPFALTSASQFRPTIGPASFYTSPDLYIKQARQVLGYSAALTDTQKVIAEYWADGPRSELPPGHWCLFAQFVSARDSHDLNKDAKMFFALTNAIFDASIVAWDAKRVFNSVRPVTAIHFLFSGKKVRSWAGPFLGTQMIDGAQWEPYQATTVVTPPFPEFISGHSTFSAAGAEILRRYTGSDRFGGSVTILAGTSRVEPGAVPAADITLSWKTFTAAANQAGISRRFGGIHFIQGDLVGRQIGPQIADQAWQKALTYFNGTAQ